MEEREKERNEGRERESRWKGRREGGKHYFEYV